MYVRLAKSTLKNWFLFWVIFFFHDKSNSETSDAGEKKKNSEQNTEQNTENNKEQSTELNKDHYIEHNIYLKTEHSNRTQNRP